jgi:hypothetical protein
MLAVPPAELVAALLVLESVVAVAPPGKPEVTLLLVRLVVAFVVSASLVAVASAPEHGRSGTFRSMACSIAMY